MSERESPFTHTHTHTDTHQYTQTHSYTYTHGYSNTHILTHTHTHTHTNTHTHTRTQTHTHIYTHTHTYTHTQTHPLQHRRTLSLASTSALWRRISTRTSPASPFSALFMRGVRLSCGSEEESWCLARSQPPPPPALTSSPGIGSLTFEKSSFRWLYFALSFASCLAPAPAAPRHP